MTQLDKILIILIVAMIIGILIILYPLIRRKSILKDLTGLYFHKKTPNGNFIIVEYLDENNKKKYREASNEDIQILKDIK